MVYPKNGLANRLRALASASIFAECTNRILYLNWLPSRDCNVEWDELFLNPIRCHPLPVSNFQVGINLYDDTVIPISWYREIPCLPVQDEPGLVAVHTCRNFRPKEMTNEAYEEAKSLFYRDLRPVDTVQKAISDISKDILMAMM